MRPNLVHFCVFMAIIVLAVSAPAGASVCVSIDEAHDTLSPVERTAALLMIGNAFDREGMAVVDGTCDSPYVLSHVRLGDTIVVTIEGPKGKRQGNAIGLDDLPNLYSQMVRSLITGDPIGSWHVIDRTNVTKAQNELPRRLASDSFAYARLGYGGVFGDRTYGVPALGFGYRAEFDTLAVDVSFFNYAFTSSTSYYERSTSAVAGSLLKIAALRYANRTSNASPYFGGGISWGMTNLENGATYWNGSGMQGELTVGHEVGRASSVKLFVQADAILPLYQVTSTTYTYQRMASGAYASSYVTHDRYAPSLVVSFGVGWQKGR